MRSRLAGSAPCSAEPPPGAAASASSSSSHGPGPGPAARISPQRRRRRRAKVTRAPLRSAQAPPGTGPAPGSRARRGRHRPPGTAGGAGPGPSELCGGWLGPRVSGIAARYRRSRSSGVIKCSLFCICSPYLHKDRVSLHTIKLSRQTPPPARLTPNRTLLIFVLLG